MMMIDWLDLSSLSAFKGIGSNIEWIGKVQLDSKIDDWVLLRHSITHTRWNNNVWMSV